MRGSPLDVPIRFAALAGLVLLAGCHHKGPPPSSSVVAARAARAAGDTIHVGYGTQSQRDITGSITTVDGESARKSTMTSMADMLEGRVPGLQVNRLSNGNVSVRIRGDRSLLKDGEPLYVVDGIPMSGSSGLLPDLDPRDVRSIQVLKDAGSLAAYGSRGANGVILINMKRPPKP